MKTPAGDVEERTPLVEVGGASSKKRIVSESRTSNADLADNKTVLWAIIILVGTVTIAQFFAAFFSHSLALVADAIQNVVDLSTYSVNLYVEYISARNDKDSWKVDRLNIMSAIFSLVGLLMVGFYVLWSAKERMAQPAEVTPTSIDATLLLGFTILGLMCDIGVLVIFTIFAKTYEVSEREDGSVKKVKNLNMISAMAHVVTDFIRSIIMACGALLIWLQQSKRIKWNINEDKMDAILSILVCICIFSASFFLLREIVEMAKHGDHRIEMIRCHDRNDS
jgi:cobalt-zinc-cadmium efflux system protein